MKTHFILNLGMDLQTRTHLFDDDMPRYSSAIAPLAATTSSASMIPRDLVWCIEELAAFGADAKVLTALLGTSADANRDAETTSATTGGEVEERIGRTLALVSVREMCEEMVGRRGEAWVPTTMDEDEDEDAERCVSAFETVADVLSGISRKEDSDGAGAGGFCIDTKGENYEAYAAVVGEATLVIENMLDVTSAESFAVKCGVAERRGPMNKRKKEPPAFRMKALAIAIDGIVREMFSSSKTPTSLSLVQKSAADACRPTKPIEPTSKPTTIEQTTIDPKPAAPKAKKKTTETSDPVARGWNDVGQRPAVAPKPVKKIKEADEPTKTKSTEAPKPKPSKRTRDAEETILTPVKQMKTTEPAAKPVDVGVSPTRRLLGNVVSAVSRTLSWASRRKSVDGGGTPVKLVKGKENDLSEAPSEDDEEEDIMPTQVAYAPPSEEDEEEEPEEMEEEEAPEPQEEEDAKMTQVDEELETPTATQRMDELPTQPVRVVQYDVAEEVADDDIEDVEPPLPSSPPGGSIPRIRAETPLPTPLPIAPRQPPEPKLRRRKTRWEPDEVLALEAGVARFGVGSWANIHQAYSHTFERHNRSQVDLKDKWRNLEKARAKSRAI